MMPALGRLSVTGVRLCVTVAVVVWLTTSAEMAWAQQGRPPAPVVIDRVQSVQEAPHAEYTGLIEPATKVLLSAEVAGRLVRLDKKQGDVVKQGEVMAVLENPALEDDYAVRLARIRETEAQVRLGEHQHQRTEQLFERKLAPAQQVEDGRLSLDVSQARLQADRIQAERMKDQLERLVIRSPIAGQVIDASLEVGQWITPNQPIFEVYNFDAYELLVGVPGRMIAQVPGRGDAQVSVPEIGAQLQGEILAVVRHVNRETGNFNLRIRVENRQGLPLSGMLAKVRVPVNTARTILTVPRDAVVRRGDRTLVVVVTDENKVQLVPVRVQGNYGGDVIVSGEGLTAGAAVVVRGNERLFPGMSVRIAGDQSTQASG